MSTFTHKCREIIPLALSFAGLGLAIVSVWFFFLKPWPGVVADDSWAIVDTPVKDYYVPGETLTWAKPKVCIPPGETTMQILFERELESGAGTVQQLAYTRIFHLTEESCSEPNFTSIMVPFGTLAGRYDIKLRACTNTPSPIDTCVEASGPRILVRANPDR